MLKSRLRTVHRWLGLTGALYVLLASLSGALLVFRVEIHNFLNQDLRTGPDTPTVSAQQVLETAEQQLGTDERVVRLYLASPGVNYEVRLEGPGGRRHLYFRSDNAEYVGSANEMVQQLTDFHRELWLGDLGRWLTTVGALTFLSTQWSGVVLGWPRKGKDWVKALAISRRSQARFIYDLHRAVGYWCLVFLSLIALTGLLFSPLKNTLHGLLYGGPAVPPTCRPAPNRVALDLALKSAAGALPEGQVQAVNLPAKEDQPYKFFMKEPQQWGRSARSWVFVDPYTAKVLLTDSVNQRHWGDALANTWSFALHTGEAFGRPHQFLWLLVSLAAASLPCTGFLMWWRKRRR